MFRNKYIFFIFFWLSIFSINGQIPGLTQFTTNNNLPSNTIYDIIQDEKGFIYFATDYGISKFDGLTFENFTVNDGLPGNEILFFKRDSKNRIWMASFNGNIGFLKDGKFFNNKNHQTLKKLLFTKYVSDISEDNDGNIWFFQNINNIKVLRTNLEIESFSVEKKENMMVSPILIQDYKKQMNVLGKVIINNQLNIFTYQLHHKNKHWIDFDANLYSSNSIKELNNNLELLIRIDEKPINSIYEYVHKSRNNNNNNNNNNRYLLKNYDISSNYWITNLNEGLYIFDQSNNYKSPKIILKNIETTRAFVDLESNIWVGSQSNGVFLFPNVNVSGFQLENPRRNDFHSINEFNNDLIIGNELSELIIIDKNTLEIKSEKSIDGYSKKIRHIQKNNDKLYIVSDFSIHEMDKSYKIKSTKEMYDPDFVAVNLKNFKHITFKEDTILTANANGISHIEISNNIVKRLWNKRSSSILQVGNDSLWVGTTTGLFLKINGGFKKFNLNSDFDNSIIYDLKSSKHGLVVASNSYGLGILNKKGFQKITASDGLLSNYIKSLHIDSNDDIWLSSNLGLNKLVLNSSQNIESISSYTTSDGLYSNDVRACYVDNLNSKAYVATSNGLNIIDISKNSSIINPPKIIITDKLVNNISLSDNHKAKFNHNLNNFQFNFSGISFKSLGNITFKYRLLGIEKEWIQTKNNTVRYSALNPGKYTFEVKAIAKNKLESTIPEAFVFTINLPFFKTWWFIILTGILFLGLATLFIYTRKKRQREKYKIEEKIESLRFKALNAQMNPHFINNLMGNINDQIASGKFSKVETNLKQFGNLVNLILNATKNNLISLEQEIEMTTLYLELQKSRFHKKLNYKIEAKNFNNDDFEYILIPPMILQPIVENSIKHGFNSSPNEGNDILIQLSTSENEYLICEISDNGSGVEDDKLTNGSGISIKNIENRLQLMCEFKRKEKLVTIDQITNEFNKLVGLKITLKIPLIKI